MSYDQYDINNTKYNHGMNVYWQNRVNIVTILSWNPCLDVILLWWWPLYCVCDIMNCNIIFWFNRQ